MRISKSIIGGLCLSLVMSVAPLAYANEATTYASIGLLSGTDRYKTAISVSNKGWTSSNKAIIVNSNSIVDALSVTPLANVVDGPILLTQKDSLNGDTKLELEDLGVKEVYIIGLEGVVSQNVETQLKSMGIKTTRLGGKGRQETALRIAEEISRYRDVSQIAVVNGDKGLSDAVSVAATAASQGMVVIPSLSNSGVNVFKEYIKNENITKSYIIGSTAVVSTAIENSLPNPERLGGKDRNETNAKVINKFYTSNELKNAYIAKDGMKKPDHLIDALSVGVLASKENAPVVIVGSSLHNAQREIFTKKKAETITQVGSGGNENAFNELKTLQNTNQNPDKIMYVTNTDKVNVRNQPSITGTLLGSIHKGEEVEYTAIVDGGWVEIKYGNNIAYVSGSYLSSKHPDDTTETVRIKYVNSQDGLKVRKGPSTGDEVLQQLNYGTKVEVVEMYGTGWAKIKHKGSYGYVSGKYLTNVQVN
ncbi:cell wall-binding repeat-containing protein [Clostridium sp.]|uniref:cell wall-binding repeat-containing protein n=1 Tax=Clostridium sp. TaxID=1506 RepID=UPI003216E9FD